MSLLSDLMVRGYVRAQKEKPLPMHSLHKEPVCVKCHEISRGLYLEVAKKSRHNAGFDVNTGIYGRLSNIIAKPPFTTMWLEWGLPHTLSSVEEGSQWAESAEGALLLSYDNPRGDDRPGVTRIVFFCDSPIGGAPVAIGAVSLLQKDGPFYDRITAAELTEAGMDFAWQVYNDNDRLGKMPDDPESLAADYFSSLGNLYIVDLAVRMMHVRNVELAEQPTKKRKKQRRLRPDQQIKWNTIKVRPQGKQYASSATSALPTLTALHVVRGHFATYTEERPLFGKYTGTFWREAHTRGDAAAGEVAKDYSVEIENKEAA